MRRFTNERRLDGAHNETETHWSTEGWPVSAADDSLGRAEELLARLEAARVKLESTDDPDQAIEVLQELAELARQIEVELQAARRAAEADAAGS